MMIKDANKNILLYFVCIMKKLVNIYGNVQLNIMHSLGCVPLLKVHQLGKIFLEWDHGLDLGKFKKLSFFITKLIFLIIQLSGKTEFQTTQLNRARRTVQFERRPSQRYARRQSHVLRERQKYI